MQKIKYLKDIDGTPFLKGDVIETTDYLAKLSVGNGEAEFADEKEKLTPRQKLLEQTEAKKKMIAEKARQKAADMGIKIEAKQEKS